MAFWGLDNKNIFKKILQFRKEIYLIMALPKTRKRKAEKRKKAEILRESYKISLTASFDCQGSSKSKMRFFEIIDFTSKIITFEQL